MTLAKPDGTLAADGIATIVPAPNEPQPIGDGVGESATKRLHQLAAVRDQLLEILAVLDQYCRSPAPATLDLAIHQLNHEIGE